MNFIKIKYTIIVLVLALPLLGLSQKSDTLSIQVDMVIAKKGLVDYFNLIPVGQEDQWGFTSHDDLQKIVIGNPIYVFSIPDDYILKYNRGKKNDFEFKKEWFLPLTIDGEIKSFIFLKGDKEVQRIVGIGGAPLATEIMEDKLFDAKKVEKHGILIVHALGQKFLIKQENNEKKFYPLGNTKISFKVEKEGSLKETDLLDNIYSQLNNN